MNTDYEIAACSRRCAVTERPIEPGSEYIAALIQSDDRLVRLDFLPDAWTEPPDQTLAWWRTVAPSVTESPKLAPQDVLLNLFQDLASHDHQQAFRYVLGLLMLRRRILRLVETHCHADGTETMVVECVRRDQQFDLPVIVPDAEQTDAIQRQIFELLYGGDASALQGEPSAVRAAE